LLLLLPLVMLLLPLAVGRAPSGARKDTGSDRWSDCRACKIGRMKKKGDNGEQTGLLHTSTVGWWWLGVFAKGMVTYPELTYCSYAAAVCWPQHKGQAAHLLRCGQERRGQKGTRAHLLLYRRHCCGCYLLLSAAACLLALPPTNTTRHTAAADDDRSREMGVRCWSF